MDGATAKAASKLGHIPALDGVRAFGVGSVMLLHTGLSIGRGGALGVDVFFVLSGFLITSLLLQEHARGGIDLAHFYIRRVLRLVPALVLLLGATCVFAAIAPLDLPPGFAIDRVLQGAGISFVYLSDVAVAYTGWDIGPFFHTWSLSIEEHFYLLWPIALLLMLRAGWTRRRVGTALAAAIVVVAAWRVVVYAIEGPTNHLRYAFDTQADHLLAGCLLAVAMPYVMPLAVRRRAELQWAATAALAVLAALVVVPLPSALMAVAGFPLLYGLSCVLLASLATTEPRGALRLLAWGPAVYIGRISYSLYLWHFVVFHALTAEALGTPKPVSIVVRVGVTFLAAAASYHLVERRFLRLKGRWQARRGARPAAPLADVG